MLRRVAFGLVVLLAGAAFLWAQLFKDRITVALDVPDGFARGALVQVTGFYERDGRLDAVQHFRGFLTDDTDLDVELAAVAPWQFRQLRVDSGHPAYRSASTTIADNPHWFRRTVTVSPEPWGADFGKTYVQPEEAKTAAALEHLRWISGEYNRDADDLLANEVLLAARMMLGSLAYAGGSKEPGWEAMRQQTIAEFTRFDADLNERVDGPCPEGYSPEPSALAPCGRGSSSVIWPE